jgi:hypothetical protein
VISKLLICPYFGPLPEWWLHWLGNVGRSIEPLGYDILLDTDEDAFRDRVARTLGIVCPPMSGGGKVWDYRPALGLLYWEELEGYDFWGHTDFDCVYGRVDQFVTDWFLNAIDMHSNHATYVNGCWSLYRNTPQMASLFMEHPLWESALEDPTPSGWAEQEFSRIVLWAEQEGRLRKAWTQWQVFSEEQLPHVHFEGERLMCLGEEVMMAHFRRTKVYPSGCLA